MLPLLRLPHNRLACTLALTLLLAGCQNPEKVPDRGPVKPLHLVSRSLDFTAWNSSEGELESGVGAFRVFGPQADLAHDVEPEYLAISDDGKRAWVGLQENNGLAEITLGAEPAIAWVKGLGLQDYGDEAHTADMDDRDGQYLPLVHPGVFGFYQPDGIHWFHAAGHDYLLTANEGDSRDDKLFYRYTEEQRFSDLVPSLSTSFDDAERASLDRLNTTRFPFSSTSPWGDQNNLTRVYTYGGRSFSVRDAETGDLVWDSGNELDLRTSEAGVYDDLRSDNKGSEPETVTTGVVGGKTLAFIGLERAASVAVYDLTVPTSPQFLQLLTHTGDLRPEGLLFVAPEDSPSGEALLVVGNEISKTVSVWHAGTDGRFSWASSRDVGLTEVDNENYTAAEINAFDPMTRRLFSIGNDLRPRIEVSVLGPDLTLTADGTIELAELGGAVNSVAASGGLVAAAIEASPKTSPGTVAVYSAKSLRLVATATTGSQPDMLTFSPDGRTLLTADEGEPDPLYEVDPLGTVTIIDLTSMY